MFCRPLTLLLETLTDANPEIVLYCVATLANIAMTVDNHLQVWFQVQSFYMYFVSDSSEKKGHFSCVVTTVS